MRTLYREVHGHDGSLAQIEKWMHSLEGKKIFDASLSLCRRIELNKELPCAGFGGIAQKSATRPGAESSLRRPGGRKYRSGGLGIDKSPVKALLLE